MSRKLDLAKQMLAEAVETRSPLPIADAVLEMERAGLSPRTIRRAREALGLEEIRAYQKPAPPKHSPARACKCSAPIATDEGTCFRCGHSIEGMTR